MNLKRKVVAASSWVLAGYAGSQVVRILTNLALTRLLFPEAFGMMAVVFAVNSGVQLLSDLGITGGIVIHGADLDDRYLNTAWTIQVIRGAAIGLLIFVTAHPLALMFSNEKLEPLFRIIALCPFISGFGSTNFALADRNLQARRRVILDFGNQVATGIITAILAWSMHSTMALAWGANASLLLQVVTGHLLLPGTPNRFRWVKECAREVLSVGRISLMTSALTYAVGDGSRLLSGTLVDSRTLGLISLGAGLATMPWQAIQRIGQRVLMPAYSEIHRGGDLQRLKRALLKARAIQIIPSWIANLLMIVLAGKIFGTIYDPRYSTAATVLQIQSVGMMASAVWSSYEGILWGMRRLRLSLALQAAQAFLLWGGIWLGFELFGPIGLVVGSAAASWASYPATYAIFRHLRLSNFLFDMAIMIPSTACAILLYLSLPPQIRL